MNDSNPFATRHIRPGALDFLFAAEGSLDSLVTRLAEAKWRGEIVGPHGSGKSTLVRALIPRLAALGLHVTLFTLRQGARRLPHHDSEDAEWFLPDATPTAESLIVGRVWVVDGAEQLSRFNFWRLKWECGWNRRGLVITTHQSLGLPPLWQTAATPELAWQLVCRLLPAGQDVISQADVEGAFHDQEGNVREMLLRLFDVHRARRRT